MRWARRRRTWAGILPTKMRLPSLALLGLLLTACTGAATDDVELEASGPPRVRPAVVERHAAQFDEELPDRPAGSQEEEAAAVYLLGHLQRAGYVVYLDPVPVENTVRGTNVVALPPSGEDPEAVVAIPYGTRAERDPSGASLGMWLELARALHVAEPDHSVEFVALGAEFTSVDDGLLGSRRLAQLLLDEGHDPAVVNLIPEETGAVAAGGPLAQDLFRVNDDIRELVFEGEVPERDVFGAAGFDQVVLHGDVDQAAETLLEFLIETAN